MKYIPYQKFAMRKIPLLLFLLLLIFYTTSALGQTASMKGRLIDSAENKSLKNSVIAVSEAKDSSLKKFTRADAQGNFEINNLDTGQYIVMVTHPYFADFFDKVTVKPGENINIGIINMLSKIKLLEEVIVKSGAPIRIKGDTTVFTADSFKVREGANVEELLRKLPGIQVDRSGQITAMGEKVERVLVDGEEFFGSDPGIATKNLRADNVKEVEVYKAKSDQATFTGIDDGQSKQTINLKLKDDKKKGYFGKIEAGGGIEDKFNNAIMLNAFKAKRKLAGYGIMSNTGTLNLDWNDQEKYGGTNNNMEVSDDGGVMIFMTVDDYNNSSGIPTNWNAGLHYSNKFNQDKQNIATGYKFVKINAPAHSETYSTYYFPGDSSNIENSINNSYSSVIKHNVNLVYEGKLDSMNTVKVRAQGNYNTTKSNFNSTSERLTDEQEFINKQTAHGNSDQQSRNASANVLWMHKFKKQYRTISINNAFNTYSTDYDGFNYSLLQYYQNNQVSYTKERDNKIVTDNNSFNYNNRIAYTEPLLKDFYMELSYGFNTNKNSNDRSVFDKGGNADYTAKIDSLSNEYEFNSMSNTPGMNFRVNKKKYSFSVGGSAAFTNYEQNDITRDMDRTYNYTNYNAQANLNYKIKPSENLYISYYGNSNAPSLNDLQPIRDYSDLLNIREGNPDLKPSFNHSFNLWYGSFKMLKERNIWANMGYNLTQNAFTQYSEYRQDSIRYYRTVNTNGVSNFYSNFGYGFKLKKAGIRLGANASVNLNRNVNFVNEPGTTNSLKNITTTNSYTFSPRISKEIPDKLDITFSPNFGYNTSIATVNDNANAKYWTSGYNIWGNWQLPKDFELNTDVNAQYRQKDSRFPANNNYTIWNAALSKKFHKKEFELRFWVNDILDQNRGYNRNFNSNSFTETYRTTLRRFYMLTFIWNITKNGSTPTAH